MKNILHQINSIAENEGISIGALERKIGASKGVLSRAIANNTDIQAKWLQIIVDNYPQYNPDWLLTGTGSMLRSGTLSPVQAAPAAPIAPAPTPTPQAPDSSSMHYIMQRYESLVAENALLKKENEELKQSRGTRITTPAYTISEKIDAHLAAEPGAHK